MGGHWREGASIDIEPRTIGRLRATAQKEGVENIDGQVADAHHLPFARAAFDAAYMSTAIGEIPDAGRAMRELGRVLSPSGTLGFSELLANPDHPRASGLIRQGAPIGFRLREKVGSFF